MSTSARPPRQRAAPASALAAIVARGPWRDAAGLGLAVLLSAIGCIALSRLPGNVAMVWYPNAIASAWLATAPLAAWPLLLVSTVLAQGAANLLIGDDLRTALSFMPANALDVLLAAAMLVWRGSAHAPMHTPVGVVRVLVWGALLPHLFGATLAAATVHLDDLNAVHEVWLGWYEGGFTGSVSLLMLVLALRRATPAARRDIFGNPWLWLGGVAVSASTVLVLAHLPYPFVFLSMALLLSTLAVPFVGMLLFGALVSATVVASMALGVFLPPPALASWEQVFVFLALAAALVPSQVMGAALAQLREAHAELAAREVALRRAHAGLEQFVRVASHDLREPLNTVTQFSALIQADHGDRLPPEAREWLQLVVGAGARMRKMLDDVLQYVRMEQGRREPHEWVDLDRVLAEVRDRLAGPLRQRGGVLECEPLGSVRGHPTMLSLLFQNLVDNGLKFVAPGQSPAVRVSAERRDGRLHVTVADTGIGIAPEDLGTLFRPFVRLQMRRHYDGTGLGLVLCRQVAEAHGGTIVVSSEPGRGSRFTVTLPLDPEGD